jgi:hypothetical protein
MRQDNEDNGLRDRMTAGVAIAGYALAVLIIVLLFALAAPVSS